MKAALYQGIHNIEIADLPDYKCGDDAIILKNIYSSICVTDDGVGFTEGEYADDGGTHVGVENIKKRLDMMINARLEMESKIGIGTKACIFIPKRRDETCIS